MAEIEIPRGCKLGVIITQGREGKWVVRGALIRENGAWDFALPVKLSEEEEKLPDDEKREIIKRYRAMTVDAGSPREALEAYERFIGRRADEIRIDGHRVNREELGGLLQFLSGVRTD